MPKLLSALAVLLSSCGGASMPQPQPTLTWRGGLVGIYQAHPSRGSIILHQGHNRFEGSVGREAEDLRPVAATFHAAGYTVFCVEMPPEPHAGLGLPDFLATSIGLLDSYGPMYVVGLSGGGWTASVLAAHDERVIRAYSVAGDGPRDVWAPAGPEAKMIADYRALYRLAGDRLVHIYNAKDPCCFSWVDTELGYPHIWDATHASHTISPWAVGWILEDING